MVSNPKCFLIYFLQVVWCNYYAAQFSAQLARFLHFALTYLTDRETRYTKDQSDSAFFSNDPHQSTRQDLEYLIFSKV